MNRRKIAGFAVGPIGAGALGFITLPITTWVFSPDVVGMLSMLQVAIGLSSVLFGLGLDQAYVREYHEAPDRPRLLRSAALPGLMLLIGVVGVITLVDPRAISTWLFGVANTGYGVIVAVCLAIAYLSVFLSLILRMQERGLAYSMSQLLARLLLLSLVLAIAMLPVRKDLVALLGAQSAALLASLLVFAWNTRRDWAPALHARIEGAEMTRMLRFGGPLILGGVASWALAAMDRVFLRSMSTYAELAVYSVAASMAAGATIVTGVFNTIWAPMVYKWVADKRDLGRIRDVSRYVMMVMFLIVCAAGAGSWIIGKLLPRAYEKVPYILPGCMLAPLLYSFTEVTGVGIAITRRTGFSLVASVVAVAVNLVLNFLFVPRLGALGAMAATAISFWCFFVLKTEIAARIWSGGTPWREHVLVVTLVASALLLAQVGVELGAVSSVVWGILFSAGVLWGRGRLAALWRYARGGKANLINRAA